MTEAFRPAAEELAAWARRRQETNADADAE